VLICLVVFTKLGVIYIYNIFYFRNQVGKRFDYEIVLWTIWCCVISHDTKLKAIYIPNILFEERLQLPVTFIPKIMD